MSREVAIIFVLLAAKPGGDLLLLEPLGQLRGRIALLVPGIQGIAFL